MGVDGVNAFDRRLTAHTRADDARVALLEATDCGEDNDSCECAELEAERAGIRFDEGYDSDME